MFKSQSGQKELNSSNILKNKLDICQYLNQLKPKK